MFDDILNVYFILNTIFILNVILIGGVLPLLERKILALTQRRVGPKYIGYKGRLQFIADALKVFFKDFVYLSKSSNFLYTVVPMLFLNINILFFINIVWCSNFFFIDIELNILLALSLTSLSNLLIFVTGILTKNKYTLIASTRIGNLFFLNEFLFNIFIIFLCIFVNSFSFESFNFVFHEYMGFFFLIPILPVYLVIILIDMNRVPFDLVEAESELILGYNVEYSGFLFGIYVLTEYLHIFFFSYLTCLIFF